ncbi:MAG: penicillin-binding protein 2 [Nitrospirae bacterium]|nr:penicillin-binding protein 2 [Nitrospirota bacterium]
MFKKRAGAKTVKPKGRGTAEGPLSGRLILVMVSVVAAFAVVTARLIHLQVLEADRLAARAASQHHKTIRLEGERGTITDRNGAILAKNMDVPSISADPSRIASASRTARTLARVLPVSARSLEKRLRDPKRHFSWVYRKTDPAVAERVMALALPGVNQVPESRRFYPKGRLMGHVVGFAGTDNHGLSGIERVFDRDLKGERITLVVERDALGRSVLPVDTRYDRPDHGADIALTVDEVIQYYVESALDRAMLETQAEAAGVLVMDPRTGEILAMAARPEFDPNRADKYHPESFRNRLITDPYEPGSTMKVFLAATALEAGVVSLTEPIDCEGGTLPLRGGAMHDAHPHDVLPFSEVLVKSSNIGSAKVAMRLGPERLYQGLRAFGFGDRTGIELGGESPGLLYPPARWSGRSLPSVAIGQELAVTPLQLVTAASAVANGGTLMRPYLVSAVTRKGVTTITRPTPVRRVISERTARDLLRTLAGVTEKGGTATQAAIPGYRVAGKTGTAQKPDPVHGGYARGKFISSFLGMVPAEDPRLVMLVVIDDPKGLYYGGTVAAPVFREAAEPILQYLGVHPMTDRTLVLADPPANGATLRTAMLAEATR